MLPTVVGQILFLHTEVFTDCQLWWGRFNSCTRKYLQIAHHGGADFIPAHGSIYRLPTLVGQILFLHMEVFTDCQL
jgi:hypothetical protein